MRLSGGADLVRGGDQRSDAQLRTMDYLRSEMSDLRGEMKALRAEFRGDLAVFRTEVREDLAAFRTEMRADIADLRASMDRRFTWLVGIQVAGLVAVIGALVGVSYR